MKKVKIESIMNRNLKDVIVLIGNRIADFRKYRIKENTYNGYVYSYYPFNDSKCNTDIRMEGYIAKTQEEFEDDLDILGFMKTDEIPKELYDNIKKDITYHNIIKLDISYVWSNIDYDIIFLKADESYTYGRFNTKAKRSLIIAINRGDIKCIKL